MRRGSQRPAEPEWRRRALIFCLLGVATAIRLASITSPPFDFSVSRQAYDALRARLIYLDDRPRLPAWERSVLAQVRPEVPQLEPPVMEHLSAFGYQLAGSEQLWIPRMLAVVFWLLGGAFVYRLGLRLGRPPVPMIAFALYLFIPFGIFASTSFQPDPMMVMLTLAALLLVVRLHEKPTAGRLLAASLSAAVAVLSKPPMPLFFIWSVFGGLAVARDGWRRGLLSSRAAVFGAASLAPSLVYYLVWLHDRSGGYVQPSLVTHPSFWRGWMTTLGTILAYPLTGLEGRRLSGFVLLALDLVVATLMLLGFRATRSGSGRALLVGAWVGYAAFAVSFAPKTSTHAYYSLPLVPIVALSVAPVGSQLLARLEAAALRVRAASLTAACLVVAALGWQVEKAVTDPRYGAQIDMYQRIGAITRHTSHGVHVERYFQSPLLYYAWIGSTTLAYPGQQIPSGYIDQQLRQITHDHGRPRYLIITALDELEAQSRLRAFAARLEAVARTDEYAIFVLSARRR
jgi:hypothetical protein